MTGAARGIGLKVTRLLSAEGYKIYGLYNSSEEAATALTKKLSNIEMYKCDLADADDVQGAIDSLGAIKFFAIINVAGIAIGDNVPSFTEEDWTKTLLVNLVSPTKLILGLKESIEEGGSIVC